MIDIAAAEIWALIAGVLVGQIVTALRLSWSEYRKFRPYVMPVRSEHYLVMEALQDLKYTSRDKLKRLRITDLMHEIERRYISQHGLKGHLRRKPSKALAPGQTCDGNSCAGTRTK